MDDVKLQTSQNVSEPQFLKGIDVTYKDMLVILKENRGKLELTDEKTLKRLFFDCCFYANHLPEWIWEAMTLEQQKSFEDERKTKKNRSKKIFLELCRQESEAYSVIKNICDCSKHVKVSRRIVDEVKRYLCIDPEVQYFKQTGKKLEVDSDGNYLEDVPVIRDLIGITISYTALDGKKYNNVPFGKVIDDCIEYLNSLLKRYALG